MSLILSRIKPVLIDSSGVFKYIQIRVKLTTKTQTLDEQTVIRGGIACTYHPDILEKFQYEELD